MKKIICASLALIMIFALVGCGSQDGDKPSSTGTSSISDAPKAEQTDKSKFDVDLTKLSSTMVYSEVYNMMTTPDDYVGKMVKMKGQFALYQATDSNGKSIPDQIYFACVIADATACCQQGLEFVLAGGYTYPDDYPELATEITVVGEFQTYMEGNNKYCHLVNAEFVN